MPILAYFFEFVGGCLWEFSEIFLHGRCTTTFLNHPSAMGEYRIVALLEGLLDRTVLGAIGPGSHQSHTQRKNNVFCCESKGEKEKCGQVRLFIFSVDSFSVPVLGM